jgi:enoyl-CoA hydratase/carnithine racemase
MFELSIDNGIARLVLNRPEARNAISADQWPRLAAAVDEAERSGARLLILSGAGQAFCAGADLGDFAAFAADQAARADFRRAMRAALDRISDVAIPTIAAIGGPCFGAGVALAMACDLRIAGPAARFAITPAKLGISYPQEDVHRLVALVGPGQAARMLFGAAAIDGQEAARIGLVELTAEEAFAEAVEALTASILANSAASLAALKKAIRLAAAGARSDPAMDGAFDALFGGDDFAWRLAAPRPRSG